MLRIITSEHLTAHMTTLPHKHVCVCLSHRQTFKLTANTSHRAKFASFVGNLCTWTVNPAFRGLFALLNTQDFKWNAKVLSVKPCSSGYLTMLCTLFRSLMTHSLQAHLYYIQTYGLVSWSIPWPLEVKCAHSLHLCYWTSCCVYTYLTVES